MISPSSIIWLCNSHVFVVGTVSTDWGNIMIKMVYLATVEWRFPRAHAVNICCYCCPYHNTGSMCSTYDMKNLWHSMVIWLYNLLLLFYYCVHCIYCLAPNHHSTALKCTCDFGQYLLLATALFPLACIALCWQEKWSEDGLWLVCVWQM